MPLVKHGRVVEDPYLRVVDDAAIPDGARSHRAGRALSRRRRRADAAQRADRADLAERSQGR